MLTMREILDIEEWRDSLRSPIRPDGRPVSDPLCTCGHGFSAHDGHTIGVGQPNVTHCSQGDGCHAFVAATPANLDRAQLDAYGRNGGAGRDPFVRFNDSLYDASIAMRPVLDRLRPSRQEAP